MKNLKIYVVLEHHTKKKDAVLHGVYRKKKWAEAKKSKLEGKDSGYVCVLTKRLT